MEVPWWVHPLVRAGKARLWRETLYFVVPPKIKAAIRWMPKDRSKVLHVFAASFGRPRDYRTGDVVYTDRVCLWVRCREVEWHWSPLAESALVAQQLHATVTQQEPMEVEVHNDMDGLTVVLDVSLWVLEYDRADEALVGEYMAGVVNLLRLFGRHRLEDLEGLLKRAGGG